MDREQARSLELQIIGQDIYDLCQLMLVIGSHQSAGYLGLILSPLIGFVAEEGNKYFEQQHLLTKPFELFASNKQSITKLRTLLKLFDDTKGGKDGLIQSFEIFRQKTQHWMDANKTEQQRTLGRFIQPDLGIYFLNNDMLYLTAVGFVATGLNQQQVSDLQDEDFANITQNTYQFSELIGQFFNGAFEIIHFHNAAQGIHPHNIRGVNLDTFVITHNDFISGELFQGIVQRTGLTSTTVVLVFLYILSQVNVVYKLLPELLLPQSNLLFRLQFLTAYHATAALSNLPAVQSSELAMLIKKLQSLQDLPNRDRVRNTLAHYGFAAGRRYVNDYKDPLNEILIGLSGCNRQDIEEWASERLILINEWSQAIASKQSLSPFRAAFGSHT